MNRERENKKHRDGRNESNPKHEKKTLFPRSEKQTRVCWLPNSLTHSLLTPRLRFDERHKLRVNITRLRVCFTLQWRLMKWCLPLTLSPSQPQRSPWAALNWTQLYPHDGSLGHTKAALLWNRAWTPWTVSLVWQFWDGQKDPTEWMRDKNDPCAEPRLWGDGSL